MAIYDFKEFFTNPCVAVLANDFFEYKENNKNKRNLVHQAIIELKNIAFAYISQIIDCDEVCESFDKGEMISYGLWTHCLAYNLDILPKIQELECKQPHFLVSIIHDQTVSIILFEKGYYEMACHYNFCAVTYYGYALREMNISRQNRAKANKRWNNQVKNLRHKYLEIFKEKGFTTYKQCAMWIYENDNTENLDFETIRKHLSKADKGIFEN